MRPIVLPIALVGLRCSGKTTVGRLVAGSLGVGFVDLDDEVCREERPAAAPGAQSIDRAGDLLAALGEARFRELEARALGRVLAREGPFVLATGGGVVERAENRALLRQRAETIWLRADPALLAARLAADPSPRPALLSGEAGGAGGAGGAAGELAALARRREGWYSGCARLVIDCGRDPPEALARRVLALAGRPIS